MRKDITSRSDIETLVDQFYLKAKQHKTIGFIFTRVIPIDWDHHIPVICDFWETTIFHNAIYKGNPLQVHLDINRKIKLEKVHFESWLTLFNDTVDEHFKGKNAEIAKIRAQSMATVIQIKLHQQNSN